MVAKGVAGVVDRESLRQTFANTCESTHFEPFRTKDTAPTSFGTGSLFGVSIAGHDPEDPERFRVAKQPKAKMLAHEASHEMPLTKEEAQEACFSGTWWEGNRKRVYELEKADNETGLTRFAGVRAYTATKSEGRKNNPYRQHVRKGDQHQPRLQVVREVLRLLLYDDTHRLLLLDHFCQ